VPAASSGDEKRQERKLGEKRNSRSDASRGRYNSMLQGAREKRASRDEGSKLPHFGSTIGSNAARFSGENRKCDMTTANGRSRDDEATGIAEEYARARECRDWKIPRRLQASRIAYANRFMRVRTWRLNKSPHCFTGKSDMCAMR